MSWSFSSGGARVRASALPSVVRCSSQEYKNLGQPRQKTQIVVVRPYHSCLCFVRCPSQDSVYLHPAFPSPSPVSFFPTNSHLFWLSTSTTHRPPRFRNVIPCHPLSRSHSLTKLCSSLFRPPLLLSNIMLLLSLHSIRICSCSLTLSFLSPCSFSLLSTIHLSLSPLSSTHKPLWTFLFFELQLMVKDHRVSQVQVAR